MFGLFDKTPPSPFLASVLADLAAGRYSKPKHDNNSYIKRWEWREARITEVWHIWPKGDLWRDNKEVPVTRSERRLIIEAWHTAMKIAKLEHKAQSMTLRD